LISRDWTVDRLIDMLVEKQDMYALCNRMVCLRVL
jgi:hypothetical protein